MYIKHAPIFLWSLLGRTKIRRLKHWVVQEEGVVCYLVIITSHIIDLVSCCFKRAKFDLRQFMLVESRRRKIHMSSFTFLLLNTELEFSPISGAMIGSLLASFMLIKFD